MYVDPNAMVGCYHAGRQVMIPNWLADRSEDGLTAMQRGGELFRKFDFVSLRQLLDQHAVPVNPTGLRVLRA